MLHFASILLIAFAQDATEVLGRWKLETLTLRDGIEYRGLVLGESQEAIEFAEIVQPPGRSMYAVIRGVPRSEAHKLTRLDEPDRQALVERFAAFRHRAIIEAGRLEQVHLQRGAGAAGDQWLYAGPSFALASTADEQRTRQCVVRIEQMFRAYRTLLPPRTVQPQPLSVMLYGSLDDYRQRLRQLDLALDNAAFYAARERTIFAGSDLNHFAERLAQVRQAHEELKANYARLDQDHARSLVTLKAELLAAGFSDSEASAEVRQRRATWTSQMEAALATSTERQRTNEQKFAEVAGRMFTRLNHEAFHAYLDTYVYPHDQHAVPTWLNEGLAQVFETGRLDGDALRIDAPDRERLAQLQADLAAEPLPLATLLAAEERSFLGPHADDSSARYYLYAWGLAWHLAFHERLLSSGRLDAYVAKEAAQQPAIGRFEQLVGRDLATFERQWREAMRAAR